MHANGSRGDTADGFAFASFFPNVIQPPIAVFGNTVFSILGKKIFFTPRNYPHDHFMHMLTTSDMNDFLFMYVIEQSDWRFANGQYVDMT